MLQATIENCQPDMGREIYFLMYLVTSLPGNQKVFQPRFKKLCCNFCIILKPFGNIKMPSKGRNVPKGVKPIRAMPIQKRFPGFFRVNQIIFKYDGSKTQACINDFHQNCSGRGLSRTEKLEEVSPDLRDLILFRFVRVASWCPIVQQLQ